MRRLAAADTTLLLVGWQDRTLRLLPESVRRVPLERATWIRQVADRAGADVIATELAPRMNGQVLPAFLGTTVISHHRLSAAVDTDLVDRLRAAQRGRVLLCGLETHLAVAQTAMDLADAGLDVLIVEDAAASVGPEEHAAALRRLHHVGVAAITAEAAAFEWCDDTTTAVHVELWRGRRTPAR